MNPTQSSKLEILREMSKLYVVNVEKECVLPNLKRISKKLKKTVDSDPKKKLKGKLRRANNARILCVPDIREFLGGFNSELCGRFDEGFRGKGDNITGLIDRVTKNTGLPDFVWRDACLRKCGKCSYCE